MKSHITLKLMWLVAPVIALILIASVMEPAVAASVAWTSPNSCRVLMNVDPVRSGRSNSPASVELNPVQTLVSCGIFGTFDESTIEVIAYNSSGQPVVFDPTRQGYEKYLLPWRIQKRYGIDTINLSFVLPNSSYRTYAVYFDTVESKLGRPWRYPGIVGDGDLFVVGYQRREINACGHDDWCDFDGDGDLDIFKGGTEPYIYCYENVGGNKFEPRGRLTTGGQEFLFPMDGNNRSWLTPEFCDWDGDGDLDLFIWGPTGPYAGELIAYENITQPGGTLTYSSDPVVVRTKSGKSIGGIVTIVDWDGDGKLDMISGRDSLINFHKNISQSRKISDIRVEDAVYIKANGVEIYVWSPRVDCVDIDDDGDLDMFVGTEEGRIYFFKNVGTRTEPVFTIGRIVAFYEYMDSKSAVKVADFDGDGLLDFVVGRYWERTQWGEQPRIYGRMYKNIGTRASPKFEARDAFGGSPYTERFQICDAVRQNGVRAVDWNNDGLLDLIASDTDGFVWFFRNKTGHLFPVFEEGERLYAGGKPLRVYGEEREARAAGYARCDICDWNNDGKKDLLVADGRGWLWLYLNEGTDAAPVLAEGQRLYAANEYNTAMLPIDGTARGSVLVCDWNNDGKKDVIFAMVGHDNLSENYNWPPPPGSSSSSGEDKGFLYYPNIGTDAEPVLGYPKWIKTTSGELITYPSRPNLGSFVDWNGDGKKDFITGEFESSVRLYINIGTGAVGAEPRFSSVDGITLVQPFTVQMCSGADAVDFNGDGDLDILTGQGHGGSGLRYYERDYIDDYINKTYPEVSLATSQHGLRIADAKSWADGAEVYIPRGVVTAVFGDYFYVESENRESGIRVVKPGHGKTIGDRVDVSGQMGTNEHGERYIAATTLLDNGSGAVAPVGMTNKAVGGAACPGQIGVTDGTGLNNIGLLVKTSGVCTLNLAAPGNGPDYYGVYYLFIDDGSGLTSWYRAADGSYKQVRGVKIQVTNPAVSVGNTLSAEGISSIELINGVYQRTILARFEMDDIVRH